MATIRLLPALSLTAALVVGAAVPAAAGGGVPSDAGDAGPSFNESRGCGPGVAGAQRPLVATPGFLPDDAVLYGPWADFFGRNRAQVEGSIVYWPIPGSGGRTARVHERALPAFQRVADGLAAEEAAGRGYRVDDAIAFAFRTVAGERNLSNHAFGNAIDINPGRNPYRADGRLITDMPAWFVEVWEDAGFCWGGDWIYVKDTMHYSWMGPRQTAGYGPVPPPYPPLTAAEPFLRRAAAVTTPFDDRATRAIALADRSGDGAEDLYVVNDHGGGLRVEAVGARSGFGVVGYRADVPARPGPGAVVLLGDWDATAAADVWVIDGDAASTTVEVYADQDDFGRAATYDVATGFDAGAEFGLSDMNRDAFIDLFVLRRTDPITVEVWSGADGFATRLLAGATSLSGVADPAGWALLLGDHDVDGEPDIFAVERASRARVRVAIHEEGYSAAPVSLTTMVDGRSPRRFGIGDYDGDGRDDIYAMGARGLDVYLGGARDAADDLTAWFRLDEFVPWDAGPECTGPGRCDQIGVVDADGRWRVKDEVSSEARDVEFGYGNPGDVPFLGDWDCDGVETPGLYRRSDGFVYLRNSNATGVADVSFFFGNPSDLPLAGDFDGDGCDTVSLYRPSEAQVYVVNRLRDGQGGLGEADYRFVFGNPGDKPFVGDFDGDGIAEVGLHRESTGLVYYRLTLTSGAADRSFIFGDPGDRLVAGDWDGDGVDTVAVYRPADGNWYVKLANGAGAAEHAVHYHRGARHEDAVPIAGRTGTDSGEADGGDGTDD